MNRSLYAHGCDVSYRGTGGVQSRLGSFGHGKSGGSSGTISTSALQKKAQLLLNVPNVQTVLGLRDVRVLVQVHAWKQEDLSGAMLAAGWA